MSPGPPRERYFGAADGFKEADVLFDRDGLGLESRRAFRNGIEVEWSRDVAGRPTGRTFKKSLAAAAMGFAVGMLATPSFAQPQREEVDARVYQWRGEDQIAGIVDAASGPKFYDHDGRGRLVRERRPDAVVERAMDAVGNVYRSRTGTDRRYGPGGRLEMADGVRYEHDEDGNQALKSGPDGDWHYRWNGHGMLREVERPDGIRVAFDYDPFARRTAKRTLSAAGTVDQEVQFVWDGHNVIHELDSERGLVSWQWEPESFTPIAKEHAGRRWTIASDHLGTPTEMNDDVGQLAWKMQLDVFGVPSFEAGTAEDCPWRWPGQYQSADYPEHYARARHYDPQGGRFISGDPLGLIAGPRTHGYPQNPVLQTDPLGLAPVDALFEHNGTVFADVNPTRRSPRVDAPIVGPPNQPGLSAISNNVFGAHAEIGAMNQSLAAGNRGGLGVLMVQGERICQFCQSDIKKMALSLGLDELHIHHLDTGELAVLRTAAFATVDNGGVTLRSRMPKSCS